MRRVRGAGARERELVERAGGVWAAEGLCEVREVRLERVGGHEVRGSGWRGARPREGKGAALCPGRTGGGGVEEAVVEAGRVYGGIGVGKDDGEEGGGGEGERECVHGSGQELRRGP